MVKKEEELSPVSEIVGHKDLLRAAWCHIALQRPEVCGHQESSYRFPSPEEPQLAGQGPGEFIGKKHSFRAQVWPHPLRAQAHSFTDVHLGVTSLNSCASVSCPAGPPVYSRGCPGDEMKACSPHGVSTEHGSGTQGGLNIHRVF